MSLNAKSGTAVVAIVGALGTRRRLREGDGNWFLCPLRRFSNLHLLHLTLVGSIMGIIEEGPAL